MSNHLGEKRKSAKEMLNQEAIDFKKELGELFSFDDQKKEGKTIVQVIRIRIYLFICISLIQQYLVKTHESV